VLPQRCKESHLDGHDAHSEVPEELEGDLSQEGRRVDDYDQKECQEVSRAYFRFFSTVLIVSLKSMLDTPPPNNFIEKCLSVTGLF